MCGDPEKHTHTHRARRHLIIPLLSGFSQFTNYVQKGRNGREQAELSDTGSLLRQACPKPRTFFATESRFLWM